MRARIILACALILLLVSCGDSEENAQAQRIECVVVNQELQKSWSNPAQTTFKVVESGALFKHRGIWGSIGDTIMVEVDADEAYYFVKSN